MRSAAQTGVRTGGLAAIGAFGIWGLAPLFWSHLKHVDSVEVLAHRILWSAVLALLVLRLRDPGLTSLRVLRGRRVFVTLLFSTGLIAINWFVFIWAVTHDRVTEASLGYYINPLVNVLLGRIFLGERLRPGQAVAVGFATAGVAYMTWSLGALPWISAALALSFGTYGLVRKRATLPALAGLAAETGLCAPLCVGFLVFGIDPSLGAIRQGVASDLVLLVLGGVITAVPLLLFAIGARRLRYSTMGMVQYLAPTLQLGLATLVFGEPFTSDHLVTFALIWAAVVIYAQDAWRFRPRA